MGENNSCKIADFGLSRTLAKENTYYQLTEAKLLPVKWMAIESLLYRKFSTYSDGGCIETHLAIHGIDQSTRERDLDCSVFACISKCFYLSLCRL